MGRWWRYKWITFHPSLTEMAIGALLAINKHGLQVPQDISLICYDSGERAPFVCPALTSVHFPIVEMAQYATQLLIDPLIPAVNFPPAIIMRDSVMPPKTAC
ncbi:LacI-family transcriptional regulator [Yersinia pestis biovar Antiqua str. UG05-0454]|nr:LacI-family transcriptional regulator [Yersinia pestis biovar Antiqua str. UG05-0454]